MYKVSRVAYNGNSRVMICTLSNAYWQQASKFSRFSPAALWVDLDRLSHNAPINTIIIIIVQLRFSSGHQKLAQKEGID